MEIKSFRIVPTKDRATQFSDYHEALKAKWQFMGDSKPSRTQPNILVLSNGVTNVLSLETNDFYTIGYLIGCCHG